ncbi:MAG: flavodoxin family protein [bacterium]|nr:flavodoxin family protein [bacterium]
MNEQVVMVQGSPRAASVSSALAEEVGQVLKARRAHIMRVRLAELTYRGCIACMACKTSHEHCVVKDDLTEVLEAVRKAGILVLSSPVYFGDVTAQTKGFIDRMFSFLTPDFYESPVKSRLGTGRTLVFVQTQGQPEEGAFADIFPRYKFFFEWLGYSRCYLVRACGIETTADTPAYRAACEQARRVAAQLGE